MKIKRLPWYSPNEYNYFTDETIPQIIYRIRYAGSGKYDLYFFHGYVNEQVTIFTGTVEECKEFAQQHFEKYILDGYFDP